MSCGLSPFEPLNNTRANSSQVSSVPGFWMDIDFGVEGHQPKSYPPGRESAYRLLDTAPNPTLIVESGHGLQAWWLFENAYELGDASAKQRYNVLSEKLHRLVADTASSNGWKLDSVRDLARVMRSPGTLNHKVPTDVKTVVLARDHGKRWSLENFERVLSSTVEPTVVRHRSSNNQLTNGKCGPGIPWKALNASAVARSLLSGDPLDYTSPSERDAAISMVAVRNGATRDHVQRLILMRRVAAGENTAKARKDDYVDRTFEFAKNVDGELPTEPDVTVVEHFNTVIQDLLVSNERHSVLRVLACMVRHARGSVFLGTRASIENCLETTERTVSTAWARLQELGYIRAINQHPFNGQAKGWKLLIPQQTNN